MTTTARTVAPSSKPRIPAREWWLIVGLLVLAMVPSIAGSVRVGGVAASDPSTPDRFADDPLPVVLHIVGAVVYAVVGAFQFPPTFRRRHIVWHRFAGRYLLVPTGFVVALSGLWMNATYVLPPIDDGLALLLSRYAVGVWMFACLVLALVAVARRRFDAHGAWMIRAYAVAMGAGTQVLTSMPPMLLLGEPDELRRLIEMDAGWLINIVAAEIVIRVRHARAARPRAAA
ncbi:DUF2306 domain-containing protein [Microbacterium halotolerans]|uniref:DUF2306 domain-containing protein n=1 Tax=Microbacterium halotolerans TaxID=246613 RepID=UPI000E6AC7D1|nr:DUF2306 domain-containing protein [Microbacterium halotolerans]